MALSFKMKGSPGIDFFNAGKKSKAEDTKLIECEPKIENGILYDIVRWNGEICFLEIM